jgi:hypothetical protein
VKNKNNEKYEAYRKLLFLSSWDTDIPWLQNEDEKGITCKICVEHYRHRKEPLEFQIVLHYNMTTIM